MNDELKFQREKITDHLIYLTKERFYTSFLKLGGKIRRERDGYIWIDFPGMNHHMITENTEGSNRRFPILFSQITLWEIDLPIHPEKWTINHDFFLDSLYDSIPYNMMKIRGIFNLEYRWEIDTDGFDYILKIDSFREGESELEPIFTTSLEIDRGEIGYFPFHSEESRKELIDNLLFYQMIGIHNRERRIWGKFIGRIT